MRILKLRLMNLNSLSGEWAIDFTHQDYQTGGLFAITGPTGSGKTTVLDAICLALYGSTPRLGLITKSSNEIMSRRTGECRAELIFETQAGRFRVHWSQHRARKNSQGALQEPRHEIADDLTGRVIESTISNTRAAVENITGMNFERFKQSMMLAQGAFAAFLQAPAHERADILEQITGTDVYTDISIEAHRRRGEERGKKEELDRQMQGMENPDYDEKALTGEREATERALKETESALTQKNEAAVWLKKIGELEAERARLHERERNLARSREEFAPEALRLEKAARARLGDGLHGQLKMLRSKRDQAAADLSAGRRSLPALEKAAEAARADMKSAEESALKAKKDESDSRPVLKRVREMDLTLRENDKQQAPLNERLKAVGAELASAAEGVFSADRHDFQSWSLKAAEVRAELAAMMERAEVQRRKLSELLAGRDLSAWRDELLKLNRRGDLLGQLAEALARRESMRKELQEAERDRQKAALDLAAASNELKSSAEKVKALEREAGRLSTRWASQQRVRSLEGQRPHLVDGRPCPLCGALEHPYADPSAIPAEDVTEAMMAESAAAIEAARKKATALTAEESRLNQLLAGLKKFAEKLAGESALLDDNINARLEALEIKADPELDPAAQVGLLTKRTLAAKTDGEGIVRDAENVGKELAALEKDLTGRTEACQAVERLLKAAAEIRADLEVLRGERAQLRQARHALFGEQQPDEVEKHLQESVNKSELALEKARRVANEAEATLEKRKTIIAETESSANNLESEIKTLIARFLAEIETQGFPDEAAWLAAGLAEEERAALEQRNRDLSKDQDVLAADTKKNAERLLAEMARSLTTATLPEIENEKAKLEADRSALRERLGVINQKLADGQKTQARRRELRERLEAQSRECLRWDRLHELIGSADGKKFRNFAQGLTFEMMVHLANRQLVGLSDRYLLTRDAAQPLELKVLDNYQAGEIRSTKNLSGGESFIVSLALALGLSRMTSRKVSVDSLFLDEGFGTLDEDSLDTALETLAGLREDGKLIGVISHVPALVNRIATQIRVRPHNGPHSLLSGPGVSGGGGLI